jgi:hypothetical protein
MAIKDFFSVRNFNDFQHYKDRTPPWIKLYNAVLDDHAFAMLPDETKWHLVAIWLLASRCDNQVPSDPNWVSRKIEANTLIRFDLIVSAGFITVHGDASKLLAKCPGSASPEERRVEKSREEVCAEPPLAADSAPPVTSDVSSTDPPPAVDPSPVALWFPLKGKGAGQWGLTEANVVEYAEVFPGVNILAECRKARQWCHDNPVRQKTRGGIKGFVTRWLGRAQNSGGSSPQPRKATAVREDN